MNRLPLRLRIVRYTVAGFLLRCLIVPTSELVFRMQARREHLARRCETLRAQRDEEEKP